MTFFSLFNRAFRELNLGKCLLITAFGMAISLLISNGYLVQQAFYALFDQNARTIYESLNQNCIPAFPDIREWLTNAFDPLFLSLSVAIAAVVVLGRFSSFQYFLVAIGIAVTGGLSLADAVGMIWQENFAISSFGQNVVANAIAGVLVALFFAAVFGGTQRLFRNSNLRLCLRPLVASTVALGCGVVCSSALQLLLTSALHPLPANVRISGKIPASRIITSATCSSTKEDWPSFIPEDARVQNLSLRWFGDLGVRWNKTQEDTTYSLDVYAVSGCSNISQIEELLDKEPIFSQESFRRVIVNTLGKLGSVGGSLFIDGKQTGISVEGSPVRIVWLDRDEGDSALDITQFLAEEMAVEARTSGSISAMMTGLLFESAEYQPSVASRDFSIVVDNQEKHITFSPPKEVDTSERLVCRVLQRDVGNEDNILFNSQMLAGLFLQIERTSRPTGIYNQSDGQLSLVDPKGWLEVSGVSQSHSCGNIGRINVNNPTGRIEIDGNSQELHGDRAFEGFGDITLSYSKDGDVVIQGEYDAAWLGIQRLNQTRKEIGALDLILMALALLVLFIWPRKWIRDDWVANESSVLRMLGVQIGSLHHDSR